MRINQVVKMYIVVAMICVASSVCTILLMERRLPAPAFAADYDLSTLIEPQDTKTELNKLREEMAEFRRELGSENRISALFATLFFCGVIFHLNKINRRLDSMDKEREGMEYICPIK